MAWVGIVTDAGNDAIESNLASGASVDIDKVEAGSGTVEPANMHSSTALVSKVDDGTIASMRNTDEGVRIQVTIGPGDSAYTLKEVGIFATVGSAKTLMVLMQDSTGTSVPAKADFPDFSYTLTALLNVNSGTITATFDTDAYVSQSAFEDAIGDLDDDKLDANLGVANAGKFLVVGSTGAVETLKIDDAEGRSF